MRLKLTDRFALNAKAREGEAQTDYFDAACGGLALRVSRAGRKTWTYHFTWGGWRVRLGLGTYPATGLAAARTMALAARAEVEAGRDPRLTSAATLAAVCDEYFTRAGLALRTGAYRKATLARLVYPQLGARPLAEVRRSDIVRLLDTIDDECGPVMADHTLAYLRRVFSWHEGRSDDFRSPIVRGMSRTRPKERARERTLTDDELRAVWHAGGVFGHFVRFLILTGARRAEAAGMRWSELCGSDWTLPACRNKTKVDLVRPLPRLALSVIGPASGGFVFSTSGGARPISGFSKFKRQFDALAPGVDPWRLHDLRRTARSLMSRAGVSSDHAERCLGHVIGGVRAWYDRHDWYDEKAAAFEALAREVERITSLPALRS
jgi:integrase